MKAQVMDHSTAESGLFEFLVLQQAQISVKQVTKKKTLLIVMFLIFAVYKNNVESFYKSQAN